MEVIFNLSKGHDRHDDTINAKVEIKEHLDGTTSIAFQALGKFVTFQVTTGHIKIRECSREFCVEGMKL